MKHALIVQFSFQSMVALRRLWAPVLCFNLRAQVETSARAHNTRYLIGLDLRAHIHRLLCHKGKHFSSSTKSLVLGALFQRMKNLLSNSFLENF